MHCGWHSTSQGTVPWQLCLANVKPVGTIQVCFSARKIIPKNNLNFKLNIFSLITLQSLRNEFFALHWILIPDTFI